MKTNMIEDISIYSWKSEKSTSSGAFLSLTILCLAAKKNSMFFSNITLIKDNEGI